MDQQEDMKLITPVFDINQKKAQPGGRSPKDELDVQKLTRIMDDQFEQLVKKHEFKI